ncbi:hypothetical protein A3F03_01970 [Candidatus Roizmanbacteria bacterium RIFCSPHIGHO2_12_FULL_41_11]|uniref:Type I restriction modification DNA specificity domain-containing protein n=3 Tax=Candidatus Roizmaniibacteriota TaxID=1752723 RepID=A0A1F7J6X9_9BACT|nr:MAG: hypothetical protein A3F03_01970 [Candidatus Roizmanbacteria bacterium RIFCSPHIGHO2_12_FULL_41_11]OGK51353.1 MAG: hypothetical protein A2966_04505 [Candidatus Roizmanbacteria bacterium RIFCSPLOWO2_01_FULL_41_22]
MLNFSIIQKSQLEGAKRIDAEYYQPEYLELDNKLEEFGKNLKTLGELLDKGNSLTGGATPLGAEYPLSGIKFLRVQNIMPGYFDLSDVVFIDEKIHNVQLKRSRLADGDVLLTITGVSYGKSVVYKKDFGEANINQHSVRIHLKNEIIPEYISAFFNSKYGRFQSDKKITGNSRPALAYEEIKSYKIPFLSLIKQLAVKGFYDRSLMKVEESNSLYKQAENLLLEKLGLADYKPKDELSFVVNFSDIKIANRMDSEYFQPKYEKLMSKLKTKSSKLLKELISMKKGFEPGSDVYQEEGKLFIRVSSVTKQELIDKDQKYLKDDLYQKLKKDFEPQIGEILLTKDANPGIAYVIKEPVEGIISGGILRLKLKENIDAEYLALCINSLIGKMQAERDAGGSIISHWRPEQMKELLIPILPKTAQEKIAELVRKFHEARKKSKELLEEAKRKVEEMIEKGDQ